MAVSKGGVRLWSTELFHHSGDAKKGFWARANLSGMFFQLSFQPISFHSMTVLGVEKGDIRSLREKKRQRWRDKERGRGSERQAGELVPPCQLITLSFLSHPASPSSCKAAKSSPSSVNLKFTHTLEGQLNP